MPVTAKGRLNMLNILQLCCKERFGTTIPLDAKLRPPTGVRRLPKGLPCKINSARLIERNVKARRTQIKRRTRRDYLT